MPRNVHNLIKFFHFAKEGNIAVLIYIARYTPKKVIHQLNRRNGFRD